MERPHVTDEVIGADQKIPDCLIKTAFLGEIETANRVGIKSKFEILDCSSSDAILGWWFFSVTPVNFIITLFVICKNWDVETLSKKAKLLW